MTEKEMLDIMGTPDTAFMGNDFLTYPANYQVYSYNNVFGASDYINIVIDTNNSIVEILSSE